MSFESDLKYEEKIYNTVIKPFLNNKSKKDCIFIRYNSRDKDIFSFLQKQNDIDILTDDRYYNKTISLKTRRKIYDDIFFETIKNVELNKKGWGYYSKADVIFYCMVENRKCRLVIFEIDEIRKLNISKYEKKYSINKINGNYAYKTEGIIIPIKDFKNIVKEFEVENEFAF